MCGGGGTDRGVLGAYVSYAVSSSTVVSTGSIPLYSLYCLSTIISLYCFHFTVFLPAQRSCCRRYAAARWRNVMADWQYLTAACIWFMHSKHQPQQRPTVRLRVRTFPRLKSQCLQGSLSLVFVFFLSLSQVRSKN